MSKQVLIDKKELSVAQSGDDAVDPFDNGK